MVQWLEDGVRVLSTRGVNRAFGSKTEGTVKQGKIGARNLPAILAPDNVKPFISEEIMARAMNPIEYRPKHGRQNRFWI